MARRRKFSTFNLSFLDVMACGFGAVILIFLIIDHASEIYAQEVNQDLLAEVNLLEEEILEGKERLAVTRNTIAHIDQQVVDADGKARSILEEIRLREEELANLDQDSLARIEHINRLKTELKNLEEEAERLKAEGENQQGEKVRQFVGEGDRQYLTGLKLGGRRILILLDSSTSMLDRSIVNIIRLRNMPDSVKRNSEKWQTALRIVDWLSAQLPQDSDYQIYTFNTDAQAVLPDTEGQWLAVGDDEQLEEAISSLGAVVPNSGTSLIKLFKRIQEFSPRPDNVYLITDGLPTLGLRSSGRSKISGKQRLKLFNESLEELPTGIPINIILSPLEGDPLAASAFWRLAQATQGSFMSPSRDWP